MPFLLLSRYFDVADEYKQLVSLLIAGFGVWLLCAVINDADWPLELNKRWIDMWGRRKARIFVGTVAVVVTVASILIGILFAPPILNI